MASAGHCRGLLSAARDIGVGTAVSARAYYTQAFGDYFSRPVDETPRNGCPYTVNLDELVDAPVTAQPATPSPLSTTVPAQTYAVTARPALSSLSLSPRRLRVGRGGTISYTLAAPATVTLRVQKATGGRYRTLSAHVTDTGAAGANVVRFSGRIGRRTLSPGRFRLQAVATDVLGTTSRLVRSRF